NAVVELSAVYENIQYLREALAEETKQREAVERQAMENAKRRAELEAAIEENQKSQHQFRHILKESQQQAEAGQGKKGGQLNQGGRRRALEDLRDFVADKLERLNHALQEEKKRCEAVEKQISEN